MVFRSLTLFARQRGNNKGPDEFWRKRKIFKLTAHLYGRKRNCYTLAIAAAQRLMTRATLGRHFKKTELKFLWEQRLEAACSEHGITFRIMNEGLTRNDILLNRKVLSELAIFEPRTFKSLTKIAWARVKVDGLHFAKDMDPPPGIITRGMLK